MSEQNQNRLLTPQQLAEQLGVGRRSLPVLEKSGVIPAPLRLGPKTLRYDCAAVMARLREAGQ